MFTVAPETAFSLESLPNGVLVGQVARPDKLSWQGTRERSIALYAPSLTAFYEVLHTRFAQPVRTSESAAVGKGYNNWRFFNTYEEALKTYEHAPEKIRAFTAKDDALQARNEQGTVLSYDVVGDVLDVGLFLEGDPECFGSLSYGNPRGLFAHILINITAPSYISGDVISHRNERIVRLVDWLEHNRVRTRIHVARLNTETVIEVRVKDYHDPFDLNGLAAATHLDFFRRLCFRVGEYSETHSYSYGRSIMVSQNIGGQMDEPPMPKDTTALAIYSENLDSREEIDAQFDEAERYIAETYNEAFTGGDSDRTSHHHDPATGLSGGHHPTKLVWS